MDIRCRLLDLVIRTDYERTPIVVNCQLGRGRSTITSIIILLIQRWLKHSRVRSSSQAGADDAEVRSKKRSPLPSYQAINSELACYLFKKGASQRVPTDLLRVIRNGLRVKDEVDDAIDKVTLISTLRAYRKDFLRFHFCSVANCSISGIQLNSLGKRQKGQQMSMRSVTMYNTVCGCLLLRNEYLTYLLPVLICQA
jgi:hypothetical protein